VSKRRLQVQPMASSEAIQNVQLDESATLRERTWVRISSLALVLCSGWLIAIAFHHIVGTVFGAGYPLNTFLFTPTDRYGDLIKSWQQAHEGDPYHAQSTAVATYFPLVYSIFWLIRGLSREAVILLYLLCNFAGVAWIAIRWLRTQRPNWEGEPRWRVIVLFTLLLAFTSYPFVFALDRGNLDPLITVMLVAALAQAKRDRWLTAAAFVATAAATKGFPLAAMLLLLKRQRWTALAFGLVVFAAFIVLPSMMLGPDFSSTIEGWQAGMSRFHQMYVLGVASAHFSADWLNAWRIWAYATHGSFSPESAAFFVNTVAFLWAVALGLHVLLFARQTWRELLGIVLIMMVFPNVISDYKLVLIIPVIFAWCTSGEEQSWRDGLFLVSAGLLLVPKHYATLFADASISCLVSPVLISLLTVVLLPTADEMKAFSERRQTLNTLAVTRWLNALAEPTGGQRQAPNQEN
jgi:hypothetical protein